MSKQLLSLLCASLAFGNPAQAVDKQVPLADFVLQSQYSKPRLSPDGKHIAVEVKLPQGDRFVPTVTIYSLPDLTVRGAIRMPAFEVPLNFLWLTNTRLIMSKGLELGDREKPVSTGEILAFNLDGTKQEYLYGYQMFKSSSRGDRIGDDYGYAYIDDIPRPRNNHVYLNTHQWDSKRSMLYDVNSANASRKLLADIDMQYLSFLQQNNGMPRFAYGTDEQRNRLLYLRDDASGSWTIQKDKAYGHGFWPLTFTLDDSAYFALYTEKGGPKQLVRQELKSGARITIAENSIGNIDVMEYDVNHVPFAAGTQIGIPRVKYFDPAQADAVLHKQLSAQFPDSIVHFINYTDDGLKLLFSVASDRDPGSYFLFDKATNKADLLFTSMPNIFPEDMAQRHPIQFKARDGLDLYGYLTMPAHATGKKVPMILLPHGGPHGVSDTWYYDDDAQFLASRGYAVLQVNYRGSGGRGDTFTKSGHRHWGDKIQDDLIDGVKWSIAQGEVDADRMCVYGASFGGYSALMLAARAPDLFKCAVGYAGVYDLALFYEEDEAKRYKRTKNIYIDYVGQDEQELAKFSPAKLAADIKMPILLVHGGKDKVAPVKHAEVMRDALIKAGRPPEWLLAPNEGHGFYDTKNATAFLEKLQAFLTKHLGN